MRFFNINKIGIINTLYKAIGAQMHHFIAEINKTNAHTCMRKQNINDNCFYLYLFYRPVLFHSFFFATLYSVRVASVHQFKKL